MLQVVHDINHICTMNRILRSKLKSGPPIASEHTANAFGRIGLMCCLSCHRLRFSAPAAVPELMAEYQTAECENRFEDSPSQHQACNRQEGSGRQLRLPSADTPSGRSRRAEDFADRYRAPLPR